MKRSVDELKAEASAAFSDNQLTVATLVAQQLASTLLAPHGSGARFGRMAFDDQKSVDGFLRQKLGKDSLSRRPGPGGRKLTYIESCKAIELANRAFGFNGWSCHIVECKEEFREKRGERWSLAYSALVRIELKDGTTHEDVGFGTSDGQRDLGAALEQAKKASISDARKRALRLFGEYLGNSCYDREHIKDVNANKPMAPLAAAPGVMLPVQQQRPPQPQQATNGAARPAACNQQQAVQQGGQNQQQAQPQPQRQSPPQIQQQQQQTHRPVQQHQQHPSPQQRAVQPQQRPPQPQQQIQQQQPQERWKPPQVLRNPVPASGNSAVQQHPAQAVSAVNSRGPVTQTASVTSDLTHSSASAASTCVSSTNTQRWGYTSNAPPPTRMMPSSNPLAAIVKAEPPVTIRAQANPQFNMEDLSLSQFDYDPTESAPKRMRT